MPFINFKIVNGKNFKMEFKKTAKIRHVTSTSLLMFSPEVSL